MASGDKVSDSWQFGNRWFVRFHNFAQLRLSLASCDRSDSLYTLKDKDVLENYFRTLDGCLIRRGETCRKLFKCIVNHRT